MFFHYTQNNSGGIFEINDNVHLEVIVEADSPDEANAKAEKIGIYFDGIDKGEDCDCCGDRWSRQYKGEGDNFPAMFGKPLEECKIDRVFNKTGVKAYVYYADGRKEVVKE